jgi:PAS domain S-box-containing protein
MQNSTLNRKIAGIFLPVLLCLPELAQAMEPPDGLHNEVLWIVLGGIILLLVAAFLLHRLRRAQKEIQTLNAILEQRVESMLQQRVAQFRTLVENAPDPIFRYDRECRRVYVNPAVERISGIPAAKLLGKTPVSTELEPSENSIKIQRCVERVLATGKPETVEVFFVAADGSEHFFQNAHVPEFAADGTVESVLSIGRDITSRKQFEQVLQRHLEQEQRQSQFFNVVPGYFYTLEHRPDNSYAMTFASPGIREMYGVSADAVMKDFSVFADVSHPDDAAMILRKAEESERDLSPYHIEYRIIHPTKGLRWIEAHSLPQRMAEGGTRWDGFMHDITERKEAEQQLQLKEFALDQASEAVYLIDSNLRFTYVNEEACRALGYSRDELIGLTLADIDRHTTPEQLQSIEEKLIADGQVTFETRHRRRDGSEFPVEIRGTFFEFQGRMMSMSLVRDITQRQRVEAEKQRLIEIMKQSVDFVGMADMQGQIIYLNPAALRMVGQPEDTAPSSLTIASIHPDRFAQQVWDTMIPTALEHGVWRGETTVLHRDGHEIPVFQTVMLHRDATGKPEFASTIMQDITERKRIETELENEKQRLKAFFHALPNMAWIKDLDGKYLACNPVFESLFGAAEAEIVGQTDYDFVDAELADEFRKKDREAIAAGVPTINEEWVNFASDKHWALLETIKAPLRDAEGRIIGILGIAHDISERKQTEITIRESEARYRANSDLLHSILESSPDVVTFALDCNYRYIAFNSKHQKTMRTIWGKEIALGMNMLDLIGTQSEREAAKRNFDSALSGESFALEEYYGDEKLSRDYWQNCWSPIRSDAGVIVGLTCFALNISWRKRMEVELADSRNFLNKIINAVSAPIFVKDRQHRFVMMNDACSRMIGHPREELLGKCDDDFFPKAQADMFREKDELVFTSGEMNANEETIVNKNGETHYLYTTKTPFRSSDGAAYLVGVVLDITERKRHELEREITQKQLAEQHAQLRTYQNELELLVKERTAELVTSNQQLRVEIDVREQIEQRLKQAIEFTEGVINAIPDLLFEVDGEGKYLNVWTQNQQMLAAQKEVLIGNNLRDILSPDAAEIVMSCLREADVNGTSFGKVIRMILPQGESWFELSVAKQSPPGSSDKHFLVLSRDITSRKQTEQALLESREQLSGLIAHREEVREEERKYIAREVHDELGQILSGLQLNISLLDYKFGVDSPQLHNYVQETMSLMDKAIGAVRHIAAALRPVELDMGIVAALKWQAERFGSHSGIQCEVRIPDEEIQLEESQAIALFRIVQESLTNILRHAKADRVVISLVHDGDDYVLKVRDNGKGFDSSKKKANSFGLVGIRERALMLDGEVSINSRPGSGTEIMVRIPRAAHLN